MLKTEILLWLYTVAGSILESDEGNERMNPLPGDVPESPLTYSLKQKRTSLTEEERSACCCSPFNVSPVGCPTVEVHGTEARCCDSNGILDLCPAIVVKVVSSVGVEEVEEVAGVATGVASSCCCSSSVSGRRQSDLVLSLLAKDSSASTGSISTLEEAFGIDKVSILALLAGDEADLEGGLLLC